MIPIIYTTPACGGMIALADREVLHAFEADVLVNWGDAEVWCVKTYPKAAWARFEAVEVVSGTSH